MDAGLVGDERVSFGHVADVRPDIFDLGSDVPPEDSRRPRRRRVKSEQRVNQRRLARAVRAEQSDAAALQLPFDVVEDRPLAEYDSQLVQFNDWSHVLSAIFLSAIFLSAIFLSAIFLSAIFLSAIFLSGSRRQENGRQENVLTEGLLLL